MVYWTYEGNEIRITADETFGTAIKRMQLTLDEWDQFFAECKLIDEEVKDKRIRLEKLSEAFKNDDKPTN